MNKIAIKNFAIWARNKLIEDISYRADLMGISNEGIKDALPQSTGMTEFYDIGMAKPYSISGDEVEQRRHLVELIRSKEKETNYKTAYKYVLEEVAYTWFNRLIAVRFMEVNDYLPSHIRVLSSDSGKMEPDLVTTPFDAELSFTVTEKQEIYHLKQENKLDQVFRILFIKQCNALNEILPELFEKTNDYTELLLGLSVIDQDGIIYHLVHDIPESDFNIEEGGQVEIIGWMYQYYNDERKNEAIKINKTVIEKEDIPAATQLFTTDWVVKYIVDNSLGRFWIERNPTSKLKDKLEFFIPFQEDDVKCVGEPISPEDLRVFDPCMGSGHFLVYAFEMLMFIYTECGYSNRDAAKSIIENNLYGLDIDDRAAQLAYFAVMMKARQYNRGILSKETRCNVFSIEESNGITKEDLYNSGSSLSVEEFENATIEINRLIDNFTDAKEFGSTLHISKYNWPLLMKYFVSEDKLGQISLDLTGLELATKKISKIIDVAKILSQKYHVVFTNPPYLNKYGLKLKKYLADNYKDYSGDLFSVFMYRNFDFCLENGYSGFMTPYVWMFIKTYEKLREYVLSEKQIISLIQLEYSAFEEATVPICAFVLKNDNINKTGIYIKLSSFKGGMNVQREKVIQAINNIDCNYLFSFDQNKFKRIPGSPIAYWVSNQVIKNFEIQTHVEHVSETRIGMATANNDLFMRLWFEIAINKFGKGIKSRNDAINSKYKWFPYCKGGNYRKWYGNMEYVVNWENDGFEIRNFKDEKTGRIRSHNYNLDYIFKPGITFTAISSSNFACRIMKDALFGSGGSGICNIDNSNLLYLLGLLNSNIIEHLLSCLSLTMNFEVNTVGILPFIKQKDNQVMKIVEETVLLSKEEWDSFETSWDFKRHPLT